MCRTAGYSGFLKIHHRPFSTLISRDSGKLPRLNMGCGLNPRGSRGPVGARRCFEVPASGR